MTAQGVQDAISGLTGKTAGKENFPVGSLLVPARLRPTVAAYYAFARRADDIADDPSLAAADKHARLDALHATLSGQPPSDAETRIAADLRDALAEKGLSRDCAADLLIAFKRDADNLSCRSWDDMLAYCRYSAMPVGRFLLALHGEDTAACGAAGDALCAAHQALNHIQDCKRDYLGLKRVYVPIDWIEDVGLTVDVLAAPRSPAPLRAVLDRALAETARLIDAARPLIPAVRDRGLRMESAAILALAERLHDKLRSRDPLAERIELGPADWAAAFGASLRGGWRGR